MKFDIRTLSDLSKNGKGEYGIGAAAVDYSDNLPTYLRITDINDDGTLNIGGLKSVDDPEAHNYFLQPNDIVFARTGASTGRNYFYDGSDGLFVYAGFLIKFSLDEKKVNPKYIKYYCLSQKYKNWIRSFSTGSTRGNINAQTLGTMEITLPPRDVQDKIVGIADSIDKKIKVNNAINDNLQQQLAIAFDEIYAEGRCGQLDELLATVESGSRPRGGAESVGIPSIGAENIERFGIYDFSKDKYISESYFLSLKRGVVQSGDVLLYKDGAYTGKVSMALDEFPHKHCAVNEHVFILRTAKARFQNALYFLMTRDDIRQKVFALASSKAAQPGLNQSELRSIPIQIPTENALIAFEQYANPMMHLIANNAKESKRLAELRDTLLPKLMSGEIDVSEVEI